MDGTSSEAFESKETGAVEPAQEEGKDSLILDLEDFRMMDTGQLEFAAKEESTFEGEEK